ncbi:type II toxin-antitoxin system RelE family toxin [Mycolicibacter virginiensis]|uniref:type II toxin-antitoxin system RelE family toxin n=1 Tax=Mycolicibacter virginiensis TaxID=1795032 RepID=UPI001F043DB8|nr:hypothetical protein [Mycolicibacter virginiensis]ULP48355.1 hypothetical protein MJO54_04190 [Mycolicibacter virginiensis]
MSDLRLDPAVTKFLDGLDAKRFRQLGRRIHDLGRDCYPADARHLSNHPGYRRIDFGEFRICYRVLDDVVHVRLVGRRNDDAVYRTLDRID